MGFDGVEPSAELRVFVRETPPAGVILFQRNVESTSQIGALTRRLRSLWPATAPPPLIAVDQEGGPVRRLRAPECPEVAAFPAMAALGAADDAALTRAVGRVTGAQLAHLGFNFDLAPVLDVDSNPANPVIGRRSFGSRPEQVARHGVAFAEGLADAGVMACGKHFPGHGDTSVDSHLALPRLDHDLERLRRVELPPFAAAVRAGLPAVMTAHIAFDALDPELPATLSPLVLARLLRGELGFDGAVLSDDLEMKAVADRYASDEIASLGLAAGVDLFLVCRSLAVASQLRTALARADGNARKLAATRVGRLRAAASDNAAHPSDGSLPLREEARALLARLAPFSS